MGLARLYGSTSAGVGEQLRQEKHLLHVGSERVNGREPDFHNPLTHKTDDNSRARKDTTVEVSPEHIRRLSETRFPNTRSTAYRAKSDVPDGV